MKMGEIKMNQKGCRLWKIKYWWRGEEETRDLDAGWMVRERREREWSVECRNEQYIASGNQKTIVTLPPITHFNLKQQIFFTQLISTHWSRGLGWSWAFMCSCCCKAYTAPVCLLTFLTLCLQLDFIFFRKWTIYIATGWNTLRNEVWTSRKHCY